MFPGKDLGGRLTCNNGAAVRVRGDEVAQVGRAHRQRPAVAARLQQLQQHAQHLPSGEGGTRAPSANAPSPCVTLPASKKTQAPTCEALSKLQPSLCPSVAQYNHKAQYLDQAHPQNMGRVRRLNSPSTETTRRHCPWLPAPAVHAAARSCNPPCMPAPSRVWSRVSRVRGRGRACAPGSRAPRTWRRARPRTRRSCAWASTRGCR